MKDRAKTRKGTATGRASEVWVNPNSTFKGPQSHRAWEHRGLAPPTAARLLELADTALGVKKDRPLKNHKAAA